MSKCGANDREEWIIRQAQGRPIDKRADFLDGACAGDAALRARIEALLAATTDAADSTVKAETADRRPDEAEGQSFGRYKLLEKLGEGGFGAVWLAEQKEPVRRKVALKIIKLGMDTKAVVARFDAERQALAMMDHPNIAKVLDAGATELGRPYFVMELVRGIRITDYCDQAQLSTKERLDLFIKVCQAIQHAHQKGIIHRDVKPSNILVTLHDGAPVPKVIDFGIAKATQGDLTDLTIHTQFQQFIGTPAYMSPEQAEMSGLDIDTRSDIYSLGVLLYELLVGRTPFDTKELMSQGIDTMRKMIREKQPVRPSTKLATLQGEELTTAAKRRSIDTSKLVQMLKGDLDWITMKCLEKDRNRRYDTANGLAMDIKRHLNNEPVVARPPSTAYRMQKFVRRNKVTVAFGVAVATVLLLGIVASTWEAVRAQRAEREQSRLRQQAQDDEHKAREAEQKEMAQRQRAAAQELAARRQAYASDMNLAFEAVAQKNVGYALELLDRHRTQLGYPDLRGWEWRYLWRQTRSDELCTLGSHARTVNLIVVSPDGRRAASTAQDRTMKLWDLGARREIAPAPALASPRALAFSADGKVLVAGAGKAVRFYDPISGQETGQPLTFTAGVSAVAFSRDGTKLAVASGGGLHLLDPVTHQEAWRGDFPDIGRITFSPDSRRLAISISNGEVILWDTIGQAQIAQWPGPRIRYAGTLEFSPDGKLLAAAAVAEGAALVWDLETLQLTKRLELNVPWIGGVVFSPDGKLAAVTSTDQSIALFDPNTWQVVRRLKGHSDEVWVAAFSPDGSTLLSGSKDETIRLWDLTPKPVASDSFDLPRSTDFATLSPDGRTVITLTAANQFAVWDSTTFTKSMTGTLPVAVRHNNNPPNTLAISSDGRLLATAGPDGVVRLWETETLRERMRYDGPTQQVSAVVFSPGEQFLAASWPDGTSKVWNVSNQQLLATLNSPEGSFGTLTFSMEHQLFAFANNRPWQVEVWDLKTPKRLVTLPGHKMFVQGLEISPDGRFLVTCGPDARVNIWDLPIGTLRKSLRGNLTSFTALAISPDGQRLFAGGGNGVIKVWDLETLQQVATLNQTGDYVNALRFLPDGNTLVSVSKSSLHLWRAPLLKQIEAGTKSGPGANEAY